VKTVREAAEPRGVRVRVFFMDEARFGQQGTTTRMWAPTGSRPTAVKQTRYEWLYLFAAVECATGHSVALQMPEANTGTMNVFLKTLSREMGSQDHAVLIMDGAGWHKARKLVVPENVTILYLPPYSPELNPVERLWAYLRSHYLANRAYDDYKHLLDAGAEAWQQLTPELLRTVCACPYLSHEIQA
jgi:transposase